MLLNAHNICRFEEIARALVAFSENPNFEDSLVESLLRHTWSFDDALRDVSHIFKRYFLPKNKSFRLFVCPELVDLWENGKVSEVRSALKNPDATLLSWAEILELSNLGVEIGSHSCKHNFFDDLSAEEASLDMSRSRQLLEYRLGKTVNTFAFPFGYSKHRHDGLSDIGLKHYSKVYWSDNSRPLVCDVQGVYNRRHVEFGACAIKGLAVGALNIQMGLVKFRT